MGTGSVWQFSVSFEDLSLIDFVRLISSFDRASLCSNSILSFIVSNITTLILFQI
jgi:hypothetical protein